MTQTPDPVVVDARRAELAANLADVSARIAAAAAAAGRDPVEVTLVVVTKTWPSSDVALLADLGVTDVAENRDQEARPKYDATADLGLRWHFVGQLQRNKVRHVLDRDIDVLLQVDLADPPQPHRGGVAPADVAALAATVAEVDRLRLAGLMAVAPLGEDPATAFARLAVLAADLRATYPGAVVLSAGMSHDLEQAVAAGATHVRVGTAVLGGRAALG